MNCDWSKLVISSFSRLDDGFRVIVTILAIGGRLGGFWERSPPSSKGESMSLSLDSAV